ncbi:MAG: TolC family protein [Rubrivivax sp.]|nr:MAG: TolC family protein [Rubrivivax sp.]
MRDLIERAWARAPMARRIEGRQREAQLATEQAGSWFPGTPALNLNYRDDRAGRDAGFKEQEIGLSTPIWSPGQRGMARDLAEADANDTQAAAEALRLSVAGEVRERAWGAVLASRNQTIAQARAESLKRLEADVIRRVQAGDMARSDALLIRQEVLAADSDSKQAQLAQIEAIHKFHALTGVMQVPELSEQDSQSKAGQILSTDWEAVIAAHPRMVAARAARALAEQRLHAAAASSREAPEVGVNVRWQRADALQPTDRAMGFSVRVPLGSGPRGRTATAAAQTELASAESQERQVREALEHELLEARDTLVVQQGMAENSLERARAAEERLALVQKAFQLGELGLTERLRAEASAREAQALSMKDQTALGLAQTRLQQAKGLLP